MVIGPKTYTILCSRTAKKETQKYSLIRGTKDTEMVKKRCQWAGLWETPQLNTKKDTKKGWNAINEWRLEGPVWGAIITWSWGKDSAHKKHTIHLPTTFKNWKPTKYGRQTTEHQQLYIWPATDRPSNWLDWIINYWKALVFSEKN